jgi:hypothetical protein
MDASLGQPKRIRQVVTKPVLFTLCNTMDNTRRDNLRRLIRDAFGDDRARFCKLAKLSKGRISQLLDPDEVFGELAAKNLVKRLGLDRGYFERELPGDPTENSSTADTLGKTQPPKMRGGVAHLPIFAAVNVAPSQTWGDIVPDNLEHVFSVALPDDSMAPEAPAGSVITFARSSSATSGQGVLLTDKDGSIYFREYRARTATTWQAVAKNSAFLPLDSAADGLTVIAVMTHISKAGSMI